MKKFAALLVMIAALSAAAAAEVRDFSMLSINLPDGWQSADPVRRSMRFSSPDGSAELALAIVPQNGGMRFVARSLANVMSKRLNGSQPVERGGRWFIEGTEKNGRKVTCLLRDIASINAVEMIQFFDPTGKHTDEIYSSIATIKYKDI